MATWVERETLIEIAVSGLAVGGFIAAVAYVGSAYGTDGLSQQGALALVALIVVFIVAMTAVGYWLSGRDG